MPAYRCQDRTRLDGLEAEIFKLVGEHATSEQWSKWLRAPLELAIAKGDIDVFTRLMDAGADCGASSRGCHGRTLLGAAAHSKNTEVVEAVLRAGATSIVDVNATFGLKQETALHVAAMRGAERVSDVLILAGADPCALDKDKQNPLHVAAEAGHDGVVGVLLQAGADPTARSKPEKRTPLHVAAAAGHAMCVSKLISFGVDKDSRDVHSETPLHLAAHHNRLAAVEELLAAGASHQLRVNSLDPPRFNALDLAAQSGHVDVVRALLRAGSPVTASDDRGYTALHVAANDIDVDKLGRNNGDVIRVLLDAGADTEAQTDDMGCTPLHFAADTDHFAADSDSRGNNVLPLLEGGANVNARSVDGCTPLHYACYHSSLGVVELLLRWGADEMLADHSERRAGETWWPQYPGVDGYDDEARRKANHEGIRRMLARAPADRSWRRRGWLVLARSCPAKMRPSEASNSGGGSGGSGGGGDAHGGGNGTEDRSKIDLERLVGGVIALSEEGVFRSVVDFL
eukprot:g8282.t1